jgi:uncharacterized protein
MGRSENDNQIDAQKMNATRLSNILIKNVQPLLNSGRYVFILSDSLQKIEAEDIILMFREKEGITFIIDKSRADELNLHYTFVAAWITLNVYSSLDSVGLTAKVANALASENISCNAVAAYHHDHVFVPFHLADKAMNLLRKL